jgi:cation transport regulator ChaB
MPSRSGEELPRTLKRSPPKAQRTWKKTHDRAVEQYGEGERAHRTAFAALKRGFEKVQDQWAPKKHPGRPSDPRSKKSTAAKRRGEGETFGGVDLYGHTKAELVARARDIGLTGATRMDKRELARAIAKRQ